MQRVAEKRSGFQKSNLWAYYFYTDADIRNAPRVTDDVYFLFQAQDGGKPQISSIVYSGHPDPALLRKYLQTLGYRPVSIVDGEERWEKPGVVTPAFYLGRDETNNHLVLSKTGYR
ncbi:hypothetical protein [Paramixta manurensis]